MAPDPGQKPDWFQEFQKAKSSSGAPGGAPAKEPGTDSTGARSAPPGSERRKHERFEMSEAQTTVFRDGVLTFLGMGKENKARVALDLSEGGLRILCEERIPVGTKVRVRIDFEKYQDAIEATGTVRWCYQSAKRKEDFFAGIMFVNLDPGQTKKIALMREWFTSPQYRSMKDSERKKKDEGGLTFPS
jgi:hypothetical protein